MKKTLKGDKIEFFGNFPRNVFCAFAVTLLTRSEKLDVDDHSCFASPSCDDQSFACRKVVLIGFFDNLHRRDFSSSHLAVLHHPPLKPNNVTVGLSMRRVSLPTSCQAGTRLLHAGFLPAWLDHHRFPTKGQKSSAAVPPRCTPAPLHPLTTRTPPDVLRVGCGPVTPPPPTMITMRSS